MIFTIGALSSGHDRRRGQMSSQPIRRVEDYTDAFLATLGVILFMVFWMIAAAIGYAWVFVTAYAIDLVFKWIGRVRQR